MTAATKSKLLRPNCHRRFEDGEYPRLVAELRRAGGLAGRHWRLLLRLALETAAAPRDLALAAWDQFDARLQIWTVPGLGRVQAKAVVLTRAARRALRVLALIAKPSDPRVFHSLPSTPLGLSISFGHAASRAGLLDFCLRDLAKIAVARRLAASDGASVAEVAWALGRRHKKSPPYFRPHLDR